MATVSNSADDIDVETRRLEQGVERLIHQAIEQGFGRLCQDPVAMQRLAVALRPVTNVKEKAARVKAVRS